MALKRLKHNRPLDICIIDQGAIDRLIAEKIAQILAELEQNRQKFDKRRAETQEKFRVLEKQRYEQKKVLKEQFAAKLKEIEAATAMKYYASRRYGVRIPKETIKENGSVSTLFSFFPRQAKMSQGVFSFFKGILRLRLPVGRKRRNEQRV